jgi:hypothetical protein
MKASSPSTVSSTVSYTRPKMELAITPSEMRHTAIAHAHTHFVSGNAPQSISLPATHLHQPPSITAGPLLPLSRSPGGSGRTRVYYALILTQTCIYLVASHASLHVDDASENLLTMLFSTSCTEMGYVVYPARGQEERRAQGPVMDDRSSGVTRRSLARLLFSMINFMCHVYFTSK